MRIDFFHKSILTAALCYIQIAFLFAQDAVIKGRVHNGHENLPNATVSLNNQNSQTNSEGEFSFSVKAGSYLLIITHAGYQKIKQEIKIEAGNTRTFDFRMMPAEQLGEVVVLGSRSNVQRSSLNTPVPVDIFPVQQLMQTGQVSLTQMLSFSVPSLTSSRPTFTDPITLRGLNPDQLLVLVNGTRRHNAAIVTPGGLRGSLGNGSVPNDLNAFLPVAIEKIEILRDGAAAQYGSDAIAGVINIQLKKSTGKTTIQLNTGKSYLGDGENISLGVNRGIALNKKGYLNFSAGLRHTASIYRGGNYKGPVYKNIPAGTPTSDSLRIRAEDDSIVAARNFNRKGLSNAGSGEHTLGGMVINGGYPFGKKTEVFWTAIANVRKSAHSNSYQFPRTTSQINPEIFPNGYKPQPYHYTIDMSGIAGIKGETTTGIVWEYSTGYGNNTDKWYIKNVNNPSQYYTLGKNAPTRFYTGTLIYGQLTNNLQGSKIISARADRFINLGFGAEWRLENFQMKEGEEASWQNYDPLRRKNGGSGGQVVPPNDVVNKSRHVAGTYIDLEMEFNKRFLINIASRYEYYTDFGNNLAGKVATRYRFSDEFSVRASVNNGFRAPSLQQRFYSFTNRSFRNGEPIIIGIVRNDSEVAKAFGVPSLHAERSLNASGGITGTLLNRVRFTIDAYWIQIKDRVVLSGRFDTTSPAVKQILRSIPEINTVQFFTNAVNTRTQGVDVVLQGNWKIKNGNLSTMLAGNFTKTRLFGKIKIAANLPSDSLNTNMLFNRYERGRMEFGQPDSKIILSLNYKIKNLNFLLRNTRFGSTAILSNDFAESSDENFYPKILTDISSTYAPKNWLTVTLGVNNVFNVYPDKLKDYRNTGEGLIIYGHEATPFGYYGGFYFVNLSFSW